ncbi:MAG: thermonuclease family protein [Desulforegulaceae bacterium]|nr:thermonuclease family protein [Desulforegulaceae bacterium]
MKKFIFIILLLFSPGFCVGADYFYSEVRFVPDGDTIILKDKRVVRYIGIDTPEINHETSNPKPFALSARDFNQKLVFNQKLKIVFGKIRSDSYKRILAYVYLPDGRMVNKLILEKGLGWTYYHKDNSEKFNEFLDIQKNAMNSGTGLWSEVSKLWFSVKANPRSMRFHSLDCKKSGRKSFIEKNPFNAFYKGYSPSRKCMGNLFEYKN